MEFTDRLRTRLIPAIVFAAGLTIVVAGALSFLSPVVAGGPDADPSGPVGPVPTASPPLPVFPAIPTPSIAPSPSAGPADTAVPTRIVIPGMRIDLPIVANPDGYPYCNVAMYHRAFHTPGEPGATFIFAHARKGMFLPLLDASRVSNGKKLLGMLVSVYTDDDRQHLYEISAVRRHQTTLDRLAAAKTDQLWLQTSEGPRGTLEKLHVVADPVTVLPASSAEAHPKARPVDCG